MSESGVSDSSFEKKRRMDPEGDSGIHPEAVLGHEYYEPVKLIDAFVSVILDKKEAAKVVKQLTVDLPVPSLNHLKRIKGSKDSPLQVLLCSQTAHRLGESEGASEHPPSLSALLGEKAERYGVLGPPFLVKVAATPPLTRAQFQEASQYWPVTFHEDKRVAQLVSGTFLSQGEITAAEKHMKLCVESAFQAARNGQLAAAAAVVDPTTDGVVAWAGDGRRGCHPLQHAAMLALDLVARSQGGGVWELADLNHHYTPCEEEARTDSSGNKTGPYLCTGYDVYLTREPCAMCSMAVLHSRVRRVFYGSSHPGGALGSCYRLHSSPGLNHHFLVFRGLLRAQCDSLTDS